MERERIASRLTRIVASDLDKQRFAALVEFLTSRSQAQVGQHGSVIDLDVGRARSVKLLLHKFLHSNGLSDHHVLSHEGVLEVVHLKQAEQKVSGPEGLKPSMPGPIVGIPHTVKPSDMIEWSSRPWL